MLVTLTKSLIVVSPEFIGTTQLNDNSKAANVLQLSYNSSA